MKRFKLLKSQKILLQMRREKIQEAINLAKIRQDQLQATLNMVMIEQGISKGELNQWHLTKDGQAVEKK